MPASRRLLCTSVSGCSALIRLTCSHSSVGTSPLTTSGSNFQPTPPPSTCWARIAISFRRRRSRSIETLPTAEVVVIPDAGHDPHEQTPLVFIAVVKAFLAG